MKGRPGLGLRGGWQFGRLNRKMAREAEESESEETALYGMCQSMDVVSTYLILFDWFWTRLGLW